MSTRLTAATCLAACLAALSLGGPAQAGPWTQGAGKLWLKLGWTEWRATERFVGVGGSQTQAADGTLFQPGDRAPLGTDIDGASLVYTSVSLDANLGLTSWLDARVWVPVVRARFEDEVQGFESTQIGDPLLGLKAALTDHLAASAMVKLPLSDVPRTANLPLSEGQPDLHLQVHMGALFDGGWTELDIGYRLRFELREDLPPARGGRRILKPGDEFTFLGKVGVKPGPDWLALMAELQGNLGSAGEDRSDPVGLVTPIAPRQWIEARAGVLADVGAGVGVQLVGGYPVWGRDFPAGPRLMASVYRSFQLY